MRARHATVKRVVQYCSSLGINVCVRHFIGHALFNPTHPFLCRCTGYGDNLNIMNSIHLLQQYVERQNKVWLSVEMDKGRGVDLADVEDPRVDLCLFCIQAHRLRPVDLRWVSYSACLLLGQNSLCIQPCTVYFCTLSEGSKNALCAWVALCSACSGV